MSKECSSLCPETHSIFFRKLFSCNSRHMQSKKQMFRIVSRCCRLLIPASYIQKKCPAQHSGINGTSPLRPTLCPSLSDSSPTMCWQMVYINWGFETSHCDGCWGWLLGYSEWFSPGLGGHFTVSGENSMPLDCLVCRRNAFWGESISISPRHQRLAVKQNFKGIGCGEKDRAGRTLKELQYQVIWDIFWVETLNCGGSYNPVILLQFSNRPSSEKLRCAAVVHAVEPGVIPNFASS